MKECAVCNGTGRVEDDERSVDTRLVLVPCWLCDGRGELDEDLNGDEEDGDGEEEDHTRLVDRAVDAWGWAGADPASPAK